MTELSLVTTSLPEIGAAGTTLGLAYTTSFVVNKLSNLLDKVNPMNKIIKVFDDANVTNADVVKNNQIEIEQLDREIAMLRAMKKNQQPQK